MSHEDTQRLHHEHYYTRQSLKLLHTAISSVVCPPDGHVFISLLKEAAHYFAHELPRHIQEEELQLFPSFVGLEGASDLRHLCEEHQELTALAAEFAYYMERFLEAPTDVTWRVVRLHAEHIEARMRHHVNHEEAVMVRLERAQSLHDDHSRIA